MGGLSWSKWSKHKVLQRSAEVKTHLPETRWLKESHVWDLLNKYGSVILKPSSKSGGSGVVQVSTEDGVRFDVHSGRFKRQVSGKKALMAYVKKQSSPHYIVQRRIRLARIQGRPFDLRVMVQRKNRNSDWTITGRLAKVAGKGYIITNTARSRGYVLPIESAIRRANLTQRSTHAFLAQIDDISLKAARQLVRSYPGLRTIGLDMAWDVHGKAWIIEANFTPMTSLFLKLKDRSMYRKIMAYKRDA